MLADPERDGPDETIHYVAPGPGVPVIFGWRNSPTEGYPRPSVWYALDRAGTRWQEVIEPREFFGGPDIVGFGGLASGPHGAFVAGTWTDSTGGVVAAVWQSHDGRTWTRVLLSSGRSEGVEIPLATGVADGPHGVLVTATAETPSHSDPSARRGLSWYSGDGRTWRSLPLGQNPGRWGDFTFDSVAATQDGWIISGTATTATGVSATTWNLSGRDMTVQAHVLATFPPGTNLSLSSAATDQGEAVVAAAVDGRVMVWGTSRGTGLPARWTWIRPPRSRMFPVQSVEVSLSAEGAIVLLRSKLQGEIWTA